MTCAEMHWPAAAPLAEKEEGMSQSRTVRQDTGIARFQVLLLAFGVHTLVVGCEPANT